MSPRRVIYTERQFYRCLWIELRMYHVGRDGLRPKSNEPIPVRAKKVSGCKRPVWQSKRVVQVGVDWGEQTRLQFCRYNV